MQFDADSRANKSACALVRLSDNSAILSASGIIKTLRTVKEHYRKSVLSVM